MTQANTVVRVRPETRAKLDQIRQLGRWTLTETVDAIADAFLRDFHGPTPETGEPSVAGSTDSDRVITDESAN